MTFSVKIENEKYGTLCDQKFSDQIQFKLFLKLVQASLELKKEFSMYDGANFLIHVPYRVLVDSIITTKSESNLMTKTYETMVEDSKRI